MDAAGAILFCLGAAAAIALHTALILGAPIGYMTMGGRNAGVLPPSARAASAMQIGLLLAFIAIVLGSAGLPSILSRGTARPLIWVVVAVSALSTILNTITPSRREHWFGIPVGLAMLAGSLVVALGG